ncbi:MAG: 16S rRNA (cytosine(1402)-N(4))-methyltransferase RsmH [Gammaproteobacteria bacterium]
MEITHAPVLVEEVVRSLVGDPAGIYIDATYGRGGHTRALLAVLDPSARLLVCDRDPEALEHARHNFAGDARVQVLQGRFSNLSHWLEAEGVMGQIQGIVFDLGVSSPQFADPRRGFSFQTDGPLDMRMSPDAGRSAADWLSRVNLPELERVIWEWGEERYARRIARAIISERRAGKGEWTTGRLAQLIARTVPRRERDKHPATRTFQAIRIAVNEELLELETTLPQAARSLRIGGRLLVVSFHSLEDRIVKHFFRDHREPRQSSPDSPSPHEFRVKSLGRPVRPTVLECRNNPRARSAILRLGERVS